MMANIDIDATIFYPRTLISHSAYLVTFIRNYSSLFFNYFKENVCKWLKKKKKLTDILIRRPTNMPLNPKAQKPRNIKWMF